MIAVPKPRRSQKNRQRKWQARFLAMLPQIQQQASHACRGQDHQQREEFIAEVVANAYCAFIRLAKQGRLDIVYPTPLADFAIRQVRGGRRVGTKLNVRDVSSPHAQRSKALRMERLDQRDADGGWLEVLIEDKHTTPADIAASRVDFAAWLATLDRRQRRIAKTLATSETTTRTARKFNVTAGRISQIRRELERAWLLFQGELPPPAAVDGPAIGAVNRSLAVVGEAV
jgi:hypothetical protein